MKRRTKLTQLEHESIEVLEHVGCQYFACRGPHKRPRDMETCVVCRLLRKLYRQRGQVEKGGSDE